MWKENILLFLRLYTGIFFEKEPQSGQLSSSAA
jgi:hypothetical protein